jgi:hypothetical protein
VRALLFRTGGRQFNGGIDDASAQVVARIVPFNHVAHDFPYPRLKMETSWGRSLALVRTLRLDYWRHHMNGDERVLEPLPSTSR